MGHAPLRKIDSLDRIGIGDSQMHIMGFYELGQHQLQGYLYALKAKLEMLKPFLSGIALLLSVFASAQLAPPDGLYLEDLRAWLKQNWYDAQFVDLGYSPARIQMYGYTDDLGGEIECIYTGFQQASEFVTFPDPINAEHLVPQSLYGSLSPMRSDIHNLRPTHGSANSARSNFPFGEVDDASANWYGIDGNGNYFSTSTMPVNAAEFSELNNGVWEPREERKGDVARQVFYFFTMYPTQAGEITVIGDVNVLYDWHLNDPVDALEMQRNNRIEEVQGNRNPYIDYADLVYTAWLYAAIAGCTNEYASNYNPEANEDDGSCEFLNGLPGCTYAAALNFNAEASIDDGSCLFEEYVWGCIYQDAINYSPLATADNGSCVFPEFNPCPSDINDDNAITVSDLLILLADFGGVCE